MGELSQSWYTKYRPKTMEEYAGQNIKNIVKKRFKKREDMPHVIFIHGSRGCGKTTFARIIAKYYQCQDLRPDGSPCENCEMCEAINDILISGNSVGIETPGVQEIDATIMNGKEAIQEVLEDAIQEPIYTDFKVLIMDEFHKVSTAAQNSMLKIIEDIPKHLVVIMATTEPQKVLQTIKSRCQLTLQVEKQSIQDMTKRLMQISQYENLKTSEEALAIIAKKGNRVPRESINLLENIAKMYDGEVTVKNVTEYIGDSLSNKYISYFEASNSSLSKLLIFVNSLKQNNVKIVDFVKGLNAFVMDSLYIKHGIALDEYPIEYIKQIKKLFEMYETSDFDVLLQIIDYVSNKITEEDSARNELLLTLTGMRVSKIKLLASGLAEENKEAITENKISVYEHSKKLKSDNSELAEQLKIDINTASINESFDNIKQVPNTKGLLDDVVIPDIEVDAEKVNKEDEARKIKSNLGNEIDGFFDKF